MGGSKQLLELEEKFGELLPSQRRYIFGPERFSILDGGFASGKSRAGILKGLILSQIYPGNRGMIGRFHGTDLTDSVIPLFFEVCPPSWIRSYVKHPTNTVTLKNGSQIMFRHIHDARAKATKTGRHGANLGWVMLDQMEEMSVEHFNSMSGRIRKAGVKHFLFGNANPNGHDWIFKMFFPGVQPFATDGRYKDRFFQVLKPNSDMVGIAVSSHENRVSNGGFVSDDYFNSLEKIYSPEWYDRYVLCSFDDFTGKIYREYEAGFGNSDYASVHNIEPFNVQQMYPNWELVVGIDVGGDSPWAVVPEYIDEWGNTIVVDGFVKPSVRTDEVAAWIKRNLPWNSPRTTFVIDPENKVVMLELREHGIHCQPATKAVQAGIIRTGGYFHVHKGRALPPWYHTTQPENKIRKFRDLGSPRTFVFNTFTTYRNEHDTYVWDSEKSNTPLKTKTQRFDTCDADRYVKMFRPEPSKFPEISDKYAHLAAFDPLSYREWTKMDKRIADRQARMKGGGSLREADMDEVPEIGIPGRYEYSAKEEW